MDMFSCQSFRTKYFVDVQVWNANYTQNSTTIPIEISCLKVQK